MSHSKIHIRFLLLKKFRIKNNFSILSKKIFRKNIVGMIQKHQNQFL
ncbi:Hypothetical Protein SLY_1066 [Strawberry lethal yellows phytoplasma (CPA) str. NZSb11]|uniref:Uncharacterized protein n=1 Tax=Strawberry lethal yellows phytoplasma (CPA) str. NZSb11 TaxID=980422 RepID=R4RNN4_PHYAS|nr:Hypothetical Protein SLY_1066 [Strawberry lethal yellows phytoplasma (CPA) str. NZSb11]